MPPAGRMPKRSAQRFRSADTMLTAGKRDRAVPATSVHHRPAPEVDAHVWCPPCPGVGVGIGAPGVTGGDCRVSEELPVTAGPMTKADRANMAVNTAMAMVGAVQVPKR